MAGQQDLVITLQVGNQIESLRISERVIATRWPDKTAEEIMEGAKALFVWQIVDSLARAELVSPEKLLQYRSENVTTAS